MQENLAAINQFNNAAFIRHHHPGRGIGQFVTRRRFAGIEQLAIAGRHIGRNNDLPLGGPVLEKLV
jgi:hypothetical protein